MNGAIKVSVETSGKGDAHKTVDKTKESLDNAGKSTKTLQDRVGALRSGLGPVNLLKEGFNFLNENIGFLSIAAGGAIAVFEVLWDVFAASPTNQVVDDIRAASTASIELAKNTQILGRTAAESQGLIRGLSQSVYELAASNAEAAGDMARAGFLRRFAGLKAVDDQLKDAKDTVSSLQQEDNKLSGIVGDAQRRNQQIRADMQKTRQEFDAGRLSTEDFGQTMRTLTTDLGLWATREKQARDRTVDVNKELVRRKAIVDELGKSLERAADNTITFEPLNITTEPGGGSSTRPERPKTDWLDVRLREVAERIELERELDEVIATREERERGGALRGEDTQSNVVDLDSYRNKRKGGYADNIRDMSMAMSESLPGMGEFAGALRTISTSWDGVAAANDNAAVIQQKFLEGRATEGEYLKAAAAARQAEARGAIASFGAVALAGAESIKNERLRAGVLATIHLGLGTALMFVPGMQAEATGHLLGAGILAGVAIFGGSSSGSSRGASSNSRSVGRPLSERTESGAISITINGPWIGASSPQETAAALHSMQRRGASSGYVPRAA